MTESTVDPQSLGMSREGLERAYAILDTAVQRGELMGAAVQVARRGVALPPRAFGRRALAAGGPQVTPETIFLLASITKPMVVAAAMLLVERGKLALDDLVADVVPGFGQNGKGGVRVRHLMTHTSGLPDQLPDNLALRARRAPLSEFVRRTCETRLLFLPGTHISYQSSGIAMLGEIARRIEGVSLPEFMRREIFQPLGLRGTSLGARDEWMDRISEYRIPGASGYGDAADTGWNWNSTYWRKLGAPWGGMLSTVEELTALLRMFLSGGKLGVIRVLSEATAEAMASDHTSVMPDVPEREKLAQRWGLGWRLNAEVSPFGDLLCRDAHGHLGATGTVAWIDPERDLTFVFLTNDPKAANRLRSRVSNAVVAAVVEP